MKSIISTIEQAKKVIEKKQQEEKQKKEPVIITGGPSTPKQSEPPPTMTTTKDDTKTVTPQSTEELINVISHVPPRNIGYDPNTGKTIQVKDTDNDKPPSIGIPVDTSSSKLDTTPTGVTGGTGTPSQLPWTYEGAKTVAESGGSLPGETEWEATQRIQTQNLDKWSDVGTDKETMRLTKGHFVGYDEEGKPIYIQESPYQVKHDYTPDNTDYTNIQTGLTQQKEQIITDIGSITDIMGQSSEEINKIRENLGILQSQIELVEKYPTGTIFTLEEKEIGKTNLKDLYPDIEGLQVSKETLYPYLQQVKEENVKALEQNLNVQTIGTSYLPSLTSQLKTIEQTEFTVGKYKELGYKVDILEKDIGVLLPSSLQTQIQTTPFESYQFSLPKGSEVHKSIFGGLEPVALTASAFIESPLAIKTIGSGIQQLVTGDTKVGESRYEELSEYSLGLHHGLDTGSYAAQVLGSGAMVEGVYLPLVLYGAGYAFSGTGASLSSKVKNIDILGKFTPAGQKIIQTGTSYVRPAVQPIVSAGKVGSMVLSSKIGGTVLLGGMYGVMEGPRQLEILTTTPERFGGEFAESLFKWGVSISAFKSGMSAGRVDIPVMSKGKGVVYSKDDILSRFYEQSRMQKMVKGVSLEESYLTPIRTKIYSKLRPTYLKLKGWVKEPGWELVETDRVYSKPFDYRPLGSWSRETIISREQIIGKSMDPFATKYPSGVWGGYETSWDYYTSEIEQITIPRFLTSEKLLIKPYGETSILKTYHIKGYEPLYESKGLVIRPEPIGYRYVGETKPFVSPYTYKSYGVPGLGYRYIGKVNPFKSPYTYQPFGTSDIGYRYISETKPFISPYTYKSYGVGDIGYRYVGETKPFVSPYKYKSYGIGDIGYRYIGKTDIMPKFPKLTWEKIYRSIEGLGLPDTTLAEINKKLIPKIPTTSKFTTGGFPTTILQTTSKTYGVSLPGGYAMAYGYADLSTLEFLEEGTQYIHPRWGKITPTMPPIVSTGPVTKTGNILEQTDISKTTNITTGVQGIIDITRIGRIDKYDINSILKTDLRKDIINEVKREIRTDIGLGLGVGLDLGLTQAQKIDQVLIQTPKLKTKTISLQITPLTPYTPTITTPTITPESPEIPSIFFLPSEPKFKSEKSIKKYKTKKGGARKRVHPVRLLYKEIFGGG